MLSIGNPCIYMHASGKNLMARVCSRAWSNKGRSLMIIEPEENGQRLRRVTVRSTSVRELSPEEKSSI